MSFSVKDWKDDPDSTTPLSAAALENLETRLSGYTDTVGATKANTSHTHAVADLGSGTPASGKYLDGGGTWTTLPSAQSGSDETVNTVATSGAAQTIPAPTTASLSLITLTANCTLTFPTAAAGRSFSLVLKQDGTGSRTVTWPTISWAGGDTEPTLTTTAGKRDVFTFLCDDGTTWLGFVAGQNV